MFVNPMNEANCLQPRRKTVWFLECDRTLSGVTRGGGGGADLAPVHPSPGPLPRPLQEFLKCKAAGVSLQVVPLTSNM
jgi:hypothetical protein